MNTRVNRTTYRTKVRRTWRQRLFSWPWRPWQAWRVSEIHLVTPLTDALPTRAKVRAALAAAHKAAAEPPTRPMYAPGTSTDDFAETVFLQSQPFVPAPLDWPVIDADALRHKATPTDSSSLHGCSSDAF